MPTYKPRKYSKRYSGANRYKSKRKRYNPKRSLTKALQPKTYYFKRTFEEIVNFTQADAGDGWVNNDNGIYKQFVYALNELPGYTDFTNLFSMYKITGAKVQMYFSNTGSEDRDGQAFSNNQLLMRIAPNPQGTSHSVMLNPLDQKWFNEVQSTKTRLCLNAVGKPVSTYTSLKQLTMLYHSGSDTDYAVTKPKWISTGEVSTPHYGMNCRFDRVSGEAFTAGFNNNQMVRVRTTLYVACKMVS